MTTVTPDIGSLSDILSRARREKREKKKSIITLVVPGTRGKLAASYRILEGDEKGEIASRFNEISKQHLQMAADLLITACVDLLEVTGKDDEGKPVMRSLGMTWYASSIARLFQIEEHSTAREALLDAIDGEDLGKHFKAYVDECNLILTDEIENLPGESEPSVEGD